jgi:hypothetical protein
MKSVQVKAVGLAEAAKPLQPGKRLSIGWTIHGRTAAAVASFQSQPGFRKSHLALDDETLDEWLGRS